MTERLHCRRYIKRKILKTETTSCARGKGRYERLLGGNVFTLPVAFTIKEKNRAMKALTVDPTK